MECDCDKIAFSGLVCAWQHMGKSLNMILMPISKIEFLPNICSPYVWILYVALFDPIGSPLDLLNPCVVINLPHRWLRK